MRRYAASRSRANRVASNSGRSLRARTSRAQCRQPAAVGCDGAREVRMGAEVAGIECGHTRRRASTNQDG